LPTNFRSQGNIVKAGNYLLPQYPKSRYFHESSAKIVIINVNETVQEIEPLLHSVKHACSNQPIMVLGRFKNSPSNFSPLWEHFEKTVTRFGDIYQTFHGAKGLEADNVLIVGCRHTLDDDVVDTVPAKDTTPYIFGAIQNRYQKHNQIEEETRLFYVAVTRAKKRLFILQSRDMPSPFVEKLIRRNSIVRVVSVEDFLENPDRVGPAYSRIVYRYSP